MSSAVSGFGDVVLFLQSWPMFILLPVTGAYLTVLLRGLQFRKMRQALRLAFTRRVEEGPGVQGEISHFQALMAALASTVGTGNIVGVAIAVGTGGPGALFWMWVTGLLGMATKFTEGVLGVHHRVMDERGEVGGGPMHYIARAVPGTTGAVLSMMYALATMGGALPCTQSSSMASALHDSFGISPLITAFVVTTLAGVAILGGVRSIGRVAGVLVPFMLMFYMLAGVIVMVASWKQLPKMLWFVFRDAFSAQSARGAFAGATVIQGIRTGMSRGMYSNEAGIGTGAIAAAAAKTRYPVTQALVAMTQTLIDTIVVCSMTGLAIVTTDAWQEVGADGQALRGVELTIRAFNKGLPGSSGGVVVTLSITLFALSTVLGWYYYGERACLFALGPRALLPFRIVYLVFTFIGAALMSSSTTLGFKFAWNFTDFMYVFMALPNLIAIVRLAPAVRDEANAHFEAEQAGVTPPSSPALGVSGAYIMLAETADKSTSSDGGL